MIRRKSDFWILPCLLLSTIGVLAGYAWSAVAPPKNLRLFGELVATPTPTSGLGWPDATNTGWAPTGITLSPTGATTGLRPGNTGWHWSGIDLRIDQDNAVVDGIDVQGCIVTGTHINITIQKSRIRGDGVYDGTTLVVLPQGSIMEDCEIGGGADGTTFNKCIGPRIYGPGTKAQRLNIHHVLSGVRPGGNSLLKDSYIHTLPMGDRVYTNSSGSYSTTDHSGGIFIENGMGDTIRHNTIIGGNSAGLFVQDYDSSLPGIGNLLVDNNLFRCVSRNGQVPTWGISIENKFIKGPITVQNNVFARGWQAGPVLLPESTVAHPLSVTHSGNIFEDDGSSVDAVTEYHPWQF